MNVSKWQIPPKGGHMESANGLYYQNMTGYDIEKRLKENDLIIIPVGSTEAHGPHANPGEDTFLVTRMAEAVAEKTGCTIAQPLWYGSHPYHHLGMPGTIIVPEDTFCGMLRAIMAGFWNAGFRKQILLNGHGQEYVIPVAIHQFAKKYQVPGIFINLNWYHAVQDHFKPKSEGGKHYETQFIHADEAETSWSLALFPEMLNMDYAVDTSPQGFMPPGHIDKAGNMTHKPIAWYGHAGLVPLEVVATPEGVVGKATLASGDKAKPGVEEFLDYFEGLINTIMEKYPVGKLPPIEQVTMRDKEEMEQLLKGPFKGGKSIYTIAVP